MQTPIAVADPVPTYREGLCRALEEAAFDALAVGDPHAWAKNEGRRGLLLTVSLPDDSDLISGLRTLNAELVVVALLRKFNVRNFEEAIRAGADGAVAWDAPPAKIIAAMRAALDGDCLVPAQMARAFAASDPAAAVNHAISPWEVHWLQMLANGATVADVARDASYSEREMFRLLNRLYRAMGARNRVEAIVMAARAGLLNSDVESNDKTP